MSENEKCRKCHGLGCGKTCDSAQNPTCARREKGKKGDARPGILLFWLFLQLLPSPLLAVLFLRPVVFGENVYNMCADYIKCTCCAYSLAKRGSLPSTSDRVSRSTMFVFIHTDTYKYSYTFKEVFSSTSPYLHFFPRPLAS